jgi:hypothetical protein
MSAEIDAILRQIEYLDDAERLILEQRFQEMLEADWTREVEIARAEAQKSGVDQRTIDDVVERLRYGS